MRILVVEDQKDLNEIIVRKLTNEHYKVDSCFNGDEALAFLSCAEYDGVILDIMLPGTTGIGVLKNMRGSGDKTPVLLLTALGTVEDRVAGLDAGADGADPWRVAGAGLPAGAPGAGAPAGDSDGVASAGAPPHGASGGMTGGILDGGGPSPPRLSAGRNSVIVPR